MQRLLPASAIAALTVLLSACGSSSSTPTSPSPSAFTITISGQAGAQSFSPNPASAGGQMVVFRNTDAVVHRIRLSDGTFLTGDLLPNATSQPVQIPSSGAHYHCSLHPDMIGIVNATSGAPPSECEGPYCDGY
jgi:plastocyanin